MPDFLTSCAALPDAAGIRIPLTGTGPSYAVLANARGAAAQVRAAWGHMESQYDAMLAANLNPHGPDDRLVVLSRVRQWLRTGEEVREVGSAAVTGFRVLSSRAARWSFSQQGVRWSVTLSLGEGNEIALRWEITGAAGTDAEFLIRPDLENRSFHTVTKAFTGPEQSFREAVRTASGSACRFHLREGVQLHLSMPGAEFSEAHEWSYMVPLPQDAERGLHTHTDLFSPGDFRWAPCMHPEISLTARVTDITEPEPQSPAPGGHSPVEYPESLPLPEAMERSMDLFMAEREGTWTVIAGYPWFLDWGRDSLIFVRGLIAAGRLTEAGSIIRRFAAWEAGGSIPNLLRGTDASNRETSDAPLWLIVAVRELCALEPGFLDLAAGDRTMRQIVLELLAAHVSGTRHGVRFDITSGLLWSPAHFTWMDTHQPAGTPRAGYPVSIQALWAACLEFGHSLDPARDWDLLAERVRASVRQLFWRGEAGFLADCLHAAPGTPAAVALADDHLRPNQLFAITLGLVRDAGMCRRILNSCGELLVPGALRTLAPRPVEIPLPVEWNGQALHDPQHPYHGRYSGAEDVSRKPAYHNGTAWPWLFPSFCEALVLTEGPAAAPLARKIMGTTAALLQDGCLGHVAEIIDGDAPHRLRGCGAQAWSASEWVRVWRILA